MIGYNYIQVTHNYVWLCAYSRTLRGPKYANCTCWYIKIQYFFFIARGEHFQMLPQTKNILSNEHILTPSKFCIVKHPYKRVTWVALLAIFRRLDWNGTHCVHVPLYPNKYCNLKYNFSHSLDQEYWQKVGRDEIETALGRPVNWNIAKNVILLVGDGMDPNTVTATRIHKESERGKLSFERFPHMGLLKVSTCVV